ncbi:thermonuclease family protein [Fulvivirgaceae bacterium QH1ED-6-2]|nr:thermonuclease family protein [Parachryseolinea silvisoli]
MSYRSAFNSDGKILNQELIRNGLAWHYKKYSSSKTMSELEATAMAGRNGLWSENNPTPPWEYRKSKRKTSQTIERCVKVFFIGQPQNGRFRVIASDLSTSVVNFI